MKRCITFYAATGLAISLSFFINYSFAQEAAPSTSTEQRALIVEEQKSHQQVHLTIGTTVSYKTFSSKHFKKARINAFTDSTILLGSTTVLHKDILVLKIIKKEKKIGGTFLVLTGALVFLTGGTGYADETVKTLIPSVLLIGTGTALLLNKKMYLAKSWVGQTVNYKSPETHRSEKGKITAVTDSTISFENEKTGNVTVLHHDEAAFKIRRDKTFGIVLVIAGIGGLAVAPIFGGYGYLFIGVPSAAMLISGIAILTSHKKIHLEKSWKLKMELKN
jgi:hypothetical protein